MRRFMVLLRKELRELMTLQTLLPFAISILVFMFIGNVVGSESDRMSGPSVTVVDTDASDISADVIETLRENDFDVTVAAPGTDAGDLALDADNAVTLVVEIPAGFGASIENREQTTLATYTIVRNLSFLATKDSGAFSAVIAAINESLSDVAITQALPDSDPQAVKRPLVARENVVLGGRSAQVSAAEVLGFISQQTTFIPIVLFLVIILAAQMIATTIASEKENKTLETLLASPLGRGQLVTAKMMAAATVALLSAGAYMVGMRYYMDQLMGGLGENATVPMRAGVLEQLGLTLSTLDYVMLGASLFAGILVALAASVIMGAFAENVRAVQALITPLMVLIMIPYFLTMFVDLETVTPLVRWFVLAIPFSHPFLVAANLYTGNATAVWLGVAYQGAWFLGLSWIAARIFASDRILTLKLTGLKRRRTAA